MNKTLLLSFFWLGFGFISAQENQDILINDYHFATQEFIETYQQNIEAEGLDKALDNFIDFKLMSIYSIDKKVDTTAYFINNLKTYEKNQSKKYLESTDLKEKLADKIYQNFKTEKKIEIFSASNEPILNPTTLEKATNTLQLLKTKICDQHDSLALQSYREENQSRPFWVKPLQLSYKMEEAMYATLIGECSTIIDEDFNRYFLKVIEEKPVDNLPPYAQIKNNLMDALGQTSYNKLLEDDLITRIQDKIEFKANQNALEEVTKVYRENFKPNKKLNFSDDKTIWKTTYTNFNQQDLIEQLNDKLKGFDSTKGEELEFIISYLIPVFKKDFMIQSYKDHLVKFEPTFAKDLHLMRETLLVNYYIEKYAYQEAENDSIGQIQYLKQNSQQYRWPKRYDLTIYRYYDKKVENELKQLIQQKKSSKEILNHFNIDGKKPVVVVTNGKLSTTNPQLPKKLNPNKKIQKGTYLTQPAFYVINDILVPRTMTIKEAGLPFLEAYKGVYHKRKLQELRKEADITIPKRLQP